MFSAIFLYTYFNFTMENFMPNVCGMTKITLDKYLKSLKYSHVDHTALFAKFDVKSFQCVSSQWYIRTQYSMFRYQSSKLM